MWDVHREAVSKDRVVEAHEAQMLQPLHLVVAVVHEPLVEPRQRRRLPHHHVRLLRIALEALHRRQQRRVVLRVPLREEIVLILQTTSEEYVKMFLRTERRTTMTRNAGVQGLFGPGDSLGGARGEKEGKATVSRSIASFCSCSRA